MFSARLWLGIYFLLSTNPAMAMYRLPLVQRQECEDSLYMPVLSLTAHSPLEASHSMEAALKDFLNITRLGPTRTTRAQRLSVRTRLVEALLSEARHCLFSPTNLIPSQMVYHCGQTQDFLAFRTSVIHHDLLNELGATGEQNKDPGLRIIKHHTAGLWLNHKERRHLEAIARSGDLKWHSFALLAFEDEDYFLLDPTFAQFIQAASSVAQPVANVQDPWEGELISAGYMRLSPRRSQEYLKKFISEELSLRRTPSWKKMTSEDTELYPQELAYEEYRDQMGRYVARTDVQRYAAQTTPAANPDFFRQVESILRMRYNTPVILQGIQEHPHEVFARIDSFPIVTIFPPYAAPVRRTVTTEEFYSALTLSSRSRLGLPDPSIP